MLPFFTALFWVILFSVIFLLYFTGRSKWRRMRSRKKQAYKIFRNQRRTARYNVLCLFSLLKKLKNLQILWCEVLPVGRADVRFYAEWDSQLPGFILTISGEMENTEEIGSYFQAVRCQRDAAHLKLWITSTAELTARRIISYVSTFHDSNCGSFWQFRY